VGFGTHDQTIKEKNRIHEPSGDVILGSRQLGFFGGPRFGKGSVLEKTGKNQKKNSSSIVLSVGVYTMDHGEGGMGLLLKPGLSPLKGGLRPNKKKSRHPEQGELSLQGARPLTQPATSGVVESPRES